MVLAEAQQGEVGAMQICVLGKVEVPIRLIIVVKNKNCQAYLMCSLVFNHLRCPVDLASSSSWLMAQQATWPERRLCSRALLKTR